MDSVVNDSKWDLLLYVNGIYYSGVNGCLQKNAIYVIRSMLHIQFLTRRFRSVIFRIFVR